MFSNLEFKIAALLSGSFNASDTLVSSAKSFTTHSVFLVMLFMYMRNSKGSYTDPCGTPEGTVWYS